MEHMHLTLIQANSRFPRCRLWLSGEDRLTSPVSHEDCASPFGALPHSPFRTGCEAGVLQGAVGVHSAAWLGSLLRGCPPCSGAEWAPTRGCAWLPLLRASPGPQAMSPSRYQQEGLLFRSRCPRAPAPVSRSWQRVTWQC